MLTSFLYFAIFFVSSIFAFSSQKRIVGVDNSYEYQTNKRLFLCAMLIPLFFIAFTNIGVDYDNYFNKISVFTLNNYNTFETDEPFFNLVSVILKTFFGNIHVVLFTYKVVTWLLFVISIYMLRDRIRLGYSVLSYLLLFYLPSFYLLSMCLAASIVFLAISIWYKHQKILLPFVLIILAAQLHNSIYVFLPSFLALIIINKYPSISDLVLLILSFIYLFSAFFSSSILSVVEAIFPWFHYSGYITGSFSGSGLMVFIKYVPLFLICFFIPKGDRKTAIHKNIYVLVLTSLLFNVLSYSIRVIQRVEFIILPLFTVFLSEVLFMKGKTIISNNKNLVILNIVIPMYIVFRGVLIFFEFVSAQTGLSSWHFFWPF